MNLKKLISGTVAAALIVSAVSVASFAAVESAARQNKEIVIYDGEYEISGTVGFNGKQPKPIKATIQDKTGDPVALKDCECFRIEYAADQELVSKLGIAVLAGNKNKNTDNGWVDKEPYNTLPFGPVDGKCTKTVTLANLGAEGTFEISLADYQESGYETVELQVTPNKTVDDDGQEFSAKIQLKVVLVSNNEGDTTTEPVTKPVTSATEPEVTEPDATEPEETQPEVTEPEETQPEVTKPEETQPEVTKPEVTKPEETQPEVTKPEETQPEVTKPEETQPEVTKPEETQPEVTKPEETQPEVTKPEETQPEVTKPEETQPEETQPEVTKPEETQPEVTKPEETQPEVTKPEETQPEVTKPEVTKPEETQPEVTKPEETQPEVTKPEETQPEVTKPEETQPEETQPEVTKPEETQPEVTKPEETQPEETQPEVTKPEDTQPEVTKPEVTKPEDTQPEETKPEETEPDVVIPGQSGIIEGSKNGETEVSKDTAIKIEIPELNVTLEAKAGTFEEAVSKIIVEVNVKVAEAAEKDKATIIAAAIKGLANASESVSVNDVISVTLKDQDGNIIQPVDGASVTVTLPYDGKSNYVAYIDGEEVEFIKLTIADGFASFEAKHFSDYYLVSLSEDAVKSVEDTVSGDTNKPSNDKNEPTGFVIALIPAAAAAAMVVVSKKRK